MYPRTPRWVITDTVDWSSTPRLVVSKLHTLIPFIRHYSIGSWPIRLYILNDQGERELSTVSTSHAVFLSEEHHFDVVLGRSFMEKRQVWPNDPSLFCGAKRIVAGQDKPVGPNRCPVPRCQRNIGLRSGHSQGREGTNRHRDMTSFPTLGI